MTADLVAMPRPRRLDHVVMPVASLDRTRGWLESLGFIVAPDAVHPFGTKNACVFFADGSFLEPLAIASRETCEAEVRAGNIFVARDQAHRFRIGEPSFSAVALASPDAAADGAAFRRAGIGEGETYRFSRPFEGSGGQVTEIGFRLSFVADRRSPDTSFFVCEAMQAAAAGRSDFLAHPNTALGIARVVLSEPNPTDFQYLLQAVANEREIGADSFGMTVPLGNAGIEVLTAEGLGVHYGASRGAERGLRFEGIVLGAADIGAVRAFAAAAGIAIEDRIGRAIVRLGQDARSFIAFEERAAL